MWQVEMARLLVELKSLLGAGGLCFGDAAVQVAQDAARWHELAVIEQAYLTELGRAQLQDVQALKLAGTDAPTVPQGMKRVLVVAAPDLPPLMHRWLRGCAAHRLTVTVAVQAPPALAHMFDEIGRPLPEFWGDDALVQVALADAAIHLRHAASAQADTVITLLRALAPGARVAVGIGDMEVGAVLEEKLALEGVRVFEPGGVSVQEVGLWHVLGQVRALIAGSSWRAFATLLRVPEVRVALTGAREGGLHVLEVADALAAEHMPVTLAHARELLTRQDEAALRLARAIAEAEKLVAELKRLPLPEAARALLIRLYGEREFSPEVPEDQRTTALGDEWLKICAEVQEESARFGLKPRPEEALAMSLEVLEKTELSEPRGEVDLVLQGWLELLWERAPNLVVAGVNEEHVPGIQIVHPFLPDRVRQQLGLPSQATRFARDAFTLRALAEQRLLNGALHVLCGQWSERGDALRPSRLLFLCDDKDLPQRVTHLFPKEDSRAVQGREPARAVAWKLRPRLVTPKVETLSPSSIRSYLECPFRHYLSSELRMEAIDPNKRELAANEFGVLAHQAFQELGRHEEMKRSMDKKAIEDFLIETALAKVRVLYGEKPAPLITLQLESLKQRLRNAAETEATEREQGWQIYQAEWMLGDKDDDKPLLIEGARLRCKVDRVERHVGSGRFRVLDFKTSDKATPPMEAHLAKVSGRKQIVDADEWKCFSLRDGTRYQWRDLQLPLYAAALRLHGLAPDAVGYFALPKSVQDTKVMIWEGFTDEWIEQALMCAAEVVSRLREGIFWPPAAKAYDRGFDELFLGDIAATVEMPLPSA